MQLPDYLASGEPARLIPVAADTHKEARAASIVLACFMGVPEFARKMLGSLGQRMGARAKIACFTEIVFKGEAGEVNCRPDGLIILDGGRGRTWRCLVEAKIARSELDPEQVISYLALAKRHKIDALLTVSNQFVALPTHHPIRVPKSALKGVGLLHWSWMYLLTQARLLADEQNFDSPERCLILSEMIRYLSHPAVGVSSFDRMNREWKELNGQIQAGARLVRSSPAVENTVSAWQQEVRDLCLLLTRKVGRPVHIRLPKAHSNDPASRIRDEAAQLVAKNELRCVLDVPDAAAPMEVLADLKRRSICVSMTLTAPKDKQRTSSRVNWLIRQLSKTMPEDIFVRATWPGRTPDTQAPLVSLREAAGLLDAGNKSAVPSRFTVLLIRDLAGRFSGTKTFIESVEAAVPAFYEQVGQHLRIYVSAPPRVRTEPTPIDEERPESQPIDNSPPEEEKFVKAPEKTVSGGQTATVKDVANS